MAPSQQGVVGGGRSMSESDLREEEEEDEEELEERRRRREGHERVRGRSYEQLDRLTIAPRRPPRTYPPPPGHLTRAPSQATMHLTTVPQVASILIFSPLFSFSFNASSQSVVVLNQCSFKACKLVHRTFIFHVLSTWAHHLHLPISSEEKLFSSNHHSHLFLPPLSHQNLIFSL